MGNHPVHLRGIRIYQRKAQHGFACQVHIDAISRVEYIQICWVMLAQYGDDARCLVQITGARIDLDQFHPRLLTQFLVVEMRKGILQVNACCGNVALPLLTNAEQNLDAPQAGAQVGCSAQLRRCIGAIAFEKQKHT